MQTLAAKKFAKEKNAHGTTIIAKKKKRNERDNSARRAFFTTPELRSFFLCGMVAYLDGIGFRHVFSLLGSSIPVSARLVIHARFRVDPDHSTGRRSWVWFRRN